MVDYAVPSIPVQSNFAVIGKSRQLGKADPNGQNAWMNGTTYGYWTPAQVAHMVQFEPKSTFVLDVRAIEDAELAVVDVKTKQPDPQRRRRFKTGYRQTPLPHNVVALPCLEDALYYIREIHPDEFERLLNAHYVVVHCDAGVSRSPLMMQALRNYFNPEWRSLKPDPAKKTLLTANKSQLIGLMQPGFAKFGEANSKEFAASTVALPVDEAAIKRMENAHLELTNLFEGAKKELTQHNQERGKGKVVVAYSPV
ncbi:hypothetical protein OC846_006336 [Tilletia horrida]|uniref:Tyrosine specific protein phosphatases domain-containing protein n=1 Tax=Tilletia horrida TaxID=155126 RepID=A0AAN6JQR4_9BASI|nr:hypothetical protein OC846_006336 [Tilletia horrida]KAK0559955.1 hypothetical protein OC861_006467 [Tilletia horrida]